MFDIDKYQGNYAMHCATEEEAKDFCKYLHSIGRRWSCGSRYNVVTNFTEYKQNTVYFFNSNMYGSLNNAKFFNFKILEWSDFMNKPFTKSNLKNGDVVLCRNKCVGIVITDKNVIVLIDGHNKLENISNDLTNSINHDYDIVGVRRPVIPAHCSYKAFDLEFGQLVYDREEVEEMTLEQVCKLLGKNIKIIK